MEDDEIRNKKATAKKKNNAELEDNLSESAGDDGAGQAPGMSMM